MSATESRARLRVQRLSRTARRDAIRRDLVEAAASLFASQGFRATTVDQVAEAAGVTTGAVYSNFSGKEDLLFAALESHAVAADLAPFLDESLSPAQQLGAFLMELTRSAATEPWQRLDRLEHELLQLARHDIRARDLIRDADRQKRANFAAWLRLEAERGRVSLLRPAEELAMSVLALLRDLAQQHQRDPNEVPVSAFAGAFESIIGSSERTN
jgi:AcrR family transcriptional regulator